MRKLVIGSRSSALALTQTKSIIRELKKYHPGLKIMLKRIMTSGDKFRDRSLGEIGGKGLFIKEIEEALLRNEIDLAVHSMKDMPAVLPSGLCVGAIPKRESVSDVILWNKKSIPDKIKIRSLSDLIKYLPKNARIGTGSVRRGAQLLSYYPNWRIIPIRGNVPTRINKLKENQFDAILLAEAGLNRLKIKYKYRLRIPDDILLPAIGQGALALECRKSDKFILKIIKRLNHRSSELIVRAERGFLSGLGADCQSPVAAYAILRNNKIILHAMIALPDGSKIIRGKISGPSHQAELLGKKLAKRLLSRGGKELLTHLRINQ